MLDGLVVPLYQAVYSVLEATASLFWIINQALLLVGYYLMALTGWLSDTAFAPIMTQVIGQTSGLLAPLFTIALLLLAISYFLRVFFELDIVEFKRAFMWLLVAVMAFQFGPELYQGTENLRRGLGSVFYEEGLNSLSGNSASIPGLAAVGTTPEVAMGTISNNFSMWLPSDVGIDGLDVALAYLFADGCDVLKASGCITYGPLPVAWYEPLSSSPYFDNTQNGDEFPNMTNDQRRAVLTSAMNGVVRMTTGVIISLFGLMEQVIHLVLSIAMGIAYLSLMIAVLFGFFKKTEAIAWSVINMIIGLFVQSLITSLLLSVVMTLVIVGAGTGNGVLLLGASIVGIILLVVLLMGAINAIKGAINGLIDSMSAVTGGHLISVTQASGMVGNTALSAGAGAIAAARTGSIMQGAGVALSGNQTLARGAMMAASTFGEETLLGSMAGHFHAGSSGAQFAGKGAAAFLLPSGRDDEAMDGVHNLYPDSSGALGTPIHSSDPYGLDAETEVDQRAGFGAARPHDPLRQNRNAYLGSGQNPSVLDDSYGEIALETESLAKAFDGLNDEDFDEGLQAYNGARQRHPQNSAASPAAVRRSFASRLSPNHPLAANPDQADAFIIAADAGVNQHNSAMDFGRTSRRIAREDRAAIAEDDPATSTSTSLGLMALTPASETHSSSANVVQADSGDDFANLSAELSAAVVGGDSGAARARRIDPVTDDAYIFQENDKGAHQRLYEDGSTVAVDADDIPMHYSNMNNPKRGGIQRPAGYTDAAGQLTYAVSQPGDEAGFDIHPGAVRNLPAYHSANPNNNMGTEAQANGDSSQTEDRFERQASATDSHSSEQNQMGGLTIVSENNTNAPHTGDSHIAASHMATAPDFDGSVLAASIDSSLEEVEDVGRSAAQPTATSPAPQAAPTAQANAVSQVAPSTDSHSASQVASTASMPQIEGDNLSAIRGIGSHTERALNDGGIHSYADLAQASPSDIQAAVPKLSTENAQRYSQQAAELSSGQIAAPSGGLTADMSGIVSGIRSALSGISLNSGNAQASAAIAQAAAVPNAAAMPAVGYYARMASGMGLSPQVAAQVVEDSAQNGNMGQDTAQAVRQALASVQTSSGGSLGDAGMQQAVNSLQQAASAMVNAVNTSDVSSGGQAIAGTPQANSGTTTVNVQAAAATLGKVADVGALDANQGD